MGVSDPKGIVTDIPRSYQWVYQKEIPLDSKELVDYAIPFIEASYRSSRASSGQAAAIGSLGILPAVRSVSELRPLRL